MTNRINHILILAFIIASGMLISSCNQGHSEAEHASENNEHDHAGHETEVANKNPDNNQVVITSRQMEAMEIQTTKLQKRNLSDIVKAFGNITLPPDQQETISPVVGGTIREIKVLSGDYVQRGQTIARIEHPEIVDLQNDFMKAQNRHEFLKTEYKRQKRLFRDSINSAKTYQQIKSEYHSNRSRLQSLRQKLKLLNLNPDELNSKNITNSYPLISPINGYVANIEANNGMNVKADQNLFLITNNDKVHIDLEVYEKDITKIEEDQSLTFNLNNNPLSTPLEGKIMKKARNFDTDKRTALIHAEITDKNKNLLPGMSVIAYIQTSDNKHISLPESAFIQDQGKTWVFMRKHQEDHSGECNHDTTEEEQHDHTDDHKENHENTDHQTSGEKSHGSSHQTHSKDFVFERIEVYKGTTEAGFSGLTFKNPVDKDAEFATGNIQAILAEMKKSSSNGGGHGHAH
ncbi:MAG: efflux RND transporter periplasmic adaptor subunit [Bacteroidales bacterium]